MRISDCFAGCANGSSVLTVQVAESNIVSDAQTYNLETVVCLQPDLTFFCSLIRIARYDPSVAMLFDPNTVATVFAPTDRVGGLPPSAPMASPPGGSLAPDSIRGY